MPQSKRKMFRSNRRFPFSALVPVICACLPLIGTVRAADAETVTLYRGLKADADGSVKWDNTSFGISGDPATLSLFNSMGSQNPSFACWLRFSVEVDRTPVKDDTGRLAVPNPPLPPATQWNPGSWTVKFDDNPSGHWSILKETIINGQSNAKSGTSAAAAFKALFDAGNAAVLNGTLTNCHG